jgi:prepilin-type N-terminal cleavage/methylation domain-containing protein
MSHGVSSHTRTMTPKGAPRGPAGFTLVELLVVIAVIAMLVAILLPAVNAARQAAGRTQCTNHLKQLALAFESHQSAMGRYPSGGWNWFDPPTYVSGVALMGKEQKAGWGFQVLPYLEAGSVVQAGAVAAVGYADPVFFCPVRRPPQTVLWKNNYRPPLPGGASIVRALCDYAGSNRDGTGIVRRFDPTRSKDVKDGMSKTLLIADKRLNLFKLGEPQNDDNDGYTVGWNADTMRRTQRPPLPDFSGNDIDDSDDRLEDGGERFGSSHAGSFNAALADGSVQVLTYDIDMSVFRSLGNRSDGDVSVAKRRGGF